jgi:cytochrome P450
MNSSTDPIAAVTHLDPYPFYADLVAHRPLYRDEALRLWVAPSAAAVTAVLTSDLCRVRPPSEPVPAALLGSPAAEIFRHLVRMNDGPGHCPFKQAVAAALDSLDPARVAAESRRWARELDSQDLADFAFRLPVTVVASLLGVPEDSLDQTVRWMRSFVPALAPGCDPEVLEQGKAAAGDLLDFFRSLPASEGLLTTLGREARRLGRGDDSVIIANGIGLMFQAHDATAGLIGNTLLALASHPEAYDQITDNPSLLSEAVLETQRFDPPVQNTRRFVARDGIVAGQTMQEGDAILVVLAAANRDPSVNPNPDRFDLFRKDRRTFTFGAGVHACPGEKLATAIAQVGIEQALRSGLDLERFAADRAYRPSVNGRIPWAAASTASARR